MTQQEYRNLGLPTDREIKSQCATYAEEAAEWMRDIATDAISALHQEVLDYADGMERDLESLYRRGGDAEEIADLFRAHIQGIRDLAEV